MSASITDVASSFHPLEKDVQKHTCLTQFIHRLNKFCSRLISISNIALRRTLEH